MGSSKRCCILSKFYIKPQRRGEGDFQPLVVSYRNSTSNHNMQLYHPEMRTVVSYRNSTSNHNCKRVYPRRRQVVSYRNSTSNHNCAESCTSLSRLYLIEILHQTTTYVTVDGKLTRCILSKFYIKPQLTKSQLRRVGVVSYRNSTSNHNYPPAANTGEIVVSYRNSTSNHNCPPTLSV